jgi:lipid-A-disaccharide synthase
MEPSVFHPRPSVARVIYVIAGEASGDARGAELLRALRERAPELEIRGAGGHQMRALAGGEIFDWADEAVVGLWDVLKKYSYFKKQFDRMLAEIARVQPAALVLIDYPGFNLRLARAVRARHPATRIIYYISPQVWAWHRGRIPQMARYLDLMLCIFPFERALYEASGLRTIFVGHPMLDSLAEKKAGVARDPALIGLFPGSREKEVRKLFPTMLEAAARLRQSRPELRFEASAASHQLAELMLAELRCTGRDETFCPVKVRDAYSLMQRAAASMVCSGTATLEAAYFGLPMVILYRVAWLTWVVGKRLVRVPHLGMPNVLAGREVAREFLQHDCQPGPIAAEVLRLLDDPAPQQRELAAVIASLGERGAGARAAAAILAEL